MRDDAAIQSPPSDALAKFDEDPFFEDDVLEDDVLEEEDDIEEEDEGLEISDLDTGGETQLSFPPNFEESSKQKK